jgi:DNA mismatch repair protein MutH
MTVGAPESEQVLLDRAHKLAGISLGDVADSHGLCLPPNLRRHKGAVGDLLESVLGATARSRPVPDFEALGIELKTVPIDRQDRACESTHVCTIPLNDLIGQRWITSTVRRKLERVLWIPVVGDRSVALRNRRIGTPCMWSPSSEEEEILRGDWEEHMELIATGRLHELDARSGTYLQVRPKAPNRDALIASSDENGAPGATLPRGFYLRPFFTTRILCAAASP